MGKIVFFARRPGKAMVETGPRLWQEVVGVVFKNGQRQCVGGIYRARYLIRMARWVGARSSTPSSP